MMSTILRGFDFPARDIDDQLRFCNPLLSFDEGEAAPIFLARDLDWQYEGDERGRWLTPVDEDEVESFATLVSGEPRRICRGEGIVLMGERFFSAVRKVGIDLDRGRSVKFRAIPEARCRIGLASPDSYSRFANLLVGEASRIFDGELSGTAGRRLSAIGEAALFLLRKCGLTSPTDLAIRQLVAARAARQTDRYRRLLTRFSLELGETEDDIHKRVGRHLEVARGGTEGRNDLTSEQPWWDQNPGSYVSDDTKHDVLSRKYLSICSLSQNRLVYFDVSSIYAYHPKQEIRMDEFGIGSQQVYIGKVSAMDRSRDSLPADLNFHMKIGRKEDGRSFGIRHTAVR